MPGLIQQDPKELEAVGFLSPLFKALDGNDPRFSSLDVGWNDDDPEVLDPWKGMLGADVIARAQQTERPKVPDLPHADALPKEKDPGRAQADLRTLQKGVNPGRVDGGIGHMLDMARAQLGTPYVFGAESAGSAFDCSGFVDWLVNRTFGIDLPHSADQQMRQVAHVTRDQLQPGDLIFYHYGRLGAGQADHVEVYMGDGKQIGTSNPSEDLDIDPVDWNNAIAFGRVGGGVAGKAPIASGGNVTAPGNLTKTKKVRKPIPREQADAPAALVGEYGDAAFSTVLADILGPDEIVTTKIVPTEIGSGPSGRIKKQLYRGFMDAGRPDLARMVGTPAFNAWVNQESGWNPGITSAANNHGMANDGLFQVWRGHSFNRNGQVSRMSPYEQAQIVAKYFGHLTPQDIERYAAEISAGTYSGWG